jgi:hypothetical protein
MSAERTLVVAPTTGGRGFSRSGVQTPLIYLESIGSCHRLKPRPPVAVGPPLVGTVSKTVARSSARAPVQRPPRVSGRGDANPCQCFLKPLNETVTGPIIALTDPPRLSEPGRNSRQVMHNHGGYFFVWGLL